MCRQNLILRWAPWSGILMPGVDALLNGLLAAVQPDYSMLQDYISNLSARDMAYSGVLRGWWIAFPLLLTPFALALRARLPMRRWTWLPPFMLQLFALGVGGCGVFYCDPGCHGKTFSGMTHFLCSDITAASLVLCPLTLSLTTWRVPHWRLYRWVNLGWFLLGGSAGLVMFLANRHYLSYPGLWERVFYGVFYFWFILIGIHLRHLARPPACGATF